MKSLRKKPLQPVIVTGTVDRQLLAVLATLLGVGLLAISSAGVFYGQSRFGDPYYFLQRQFLFGVVPGLAAMWFFARVDYHHWRRFSFLFFFATIVCLVLIFIPGMGNKIYGASRWLQIGSFSFQPSEMAKLSIVLYLSAWLARQGRRQVSDFYEGLVPFLVVIGLLAFLIIKQPDTGTLGLIFFTAFAIFFAAGARISHLGLIIGGAASFLGLLIMFEPYRLARFTVFMDPSHDPQGLGYQINQALLGIGSGGWLGLGLGHSRQKFNYLPEPVTDSIFAIFSEEVGFIGASILVGLFVWLAIRGFRAARRAPDEFGRLTAIGITSWITCQAFINIAAITGLIPLTGVPLPFVSYGGTSLVFLLTASGILLNISSQGETR